MTGQADGSIIVDTEVNPEGFKAGSSELLAAIKSLSSEVKELGKILKDAFSNNNRGIASTDGYVQQLEATVASLKQEVESLQTKVAELQSQLDKLGTNKDVQNPVTAMSEAAQAAESKIAALQAEVQRLNGVIATLQSKLAQVMAAPAAPTIDTSEAEIKIADLEAKIQQLEETISSLRNGSATIPAPQADFSGTTEKTSALKRSIDAVTGSVNNLKPTFDNAMSGSASAMESFKAKATALETKIASLREKLKAMGNTKMPTEDYRRLSAETEKAGLKLEGLLNRQERMQAMGVKQNSAQWKNLQYDLDLAARKYDQLYAAKVRMEQSGTAFISGSSTAAYSQMASQIVAAQNALAGMQAQAARVEAKAHGISGAFRKVGTAVRTAAKSVGGALLKGLKKALQATKNLILHNNKYGRSFQKLRSIVGRFSLGLLGVRAIYGILTRAVTKFMESNQELSNQLESCWTSLGNLLGPLITRIIGLVTTAISYVTAFLKLLGITGSAAADATKEAGGAAEKAQRYLAGFDELNVMPDKSSSGGGADSTVEPIPDADLPKWVEDMVGLMKSGKWAEAAKTLTDNLNRLMDEVDWAGIGNKIGRGLDGALEFLATAIKTFNWEELGSNFATSLNGIISGVDWGNLGVVLTSGFAILMQALTGFFSTLDGAEVSNAIHEFIRGGIDACDWVGCAGRLSKAISDFLMSVDYKQLAMDLSDAFLTVLLVLKEAITNFDWHGLGKAVGEFLASIDWAGVLATIAELVWEAVKAAIETVCGFLEGLGPEMIVAAIAAVVAAIAGKIAVTTLLAPIVSAIGTALAEVVAGIVAAIGGWPALLIAAAAAAIAALAVWIKNGGAEVIAGWWEGMKEGLKNIGSWIKEHIVDPFVNWFKKLFGIHSPSTVMAEQGGFIIDGLLKGITEAWTSVTDFIGNALSSLGDAISSAWSNVVSWTKNAWSNVTANISSAWSNIKSAASSGYNAVKSGVSSAWSQIKSNASSAWSGIKSTVSSAWSGIKSAATNGYNSVKSGVLNAWSSIRSNTATAWSNIKNTIKNQGWSGIGTNICQGIGNGLSNGWSWLSRQVNNLARNMLNAAKRALGIHSPSRMFRDAVGLNIGYGIGEGIEASEGSILGSVTGVANAIAEEFNAGQYSGSLLPTAEVDGALTSFADKVTDNFTALLDKMDALAKNVGFTVPAFAGSVAPYGVSAGYMARSAYSDGTSTDTSIMTAVLAELQSLSRIVQNLDVGHSGDTKVLIDGHEVFRTVVDYNNRAIRCNGKSPLKSTR